MHELGGGRVGESHRCVPFKGFNIKMFLQESQGYMRTVSDAHLFYDFKSAKNNFDKENKVLSPRPVQKTKKKPAVSSPAPKRPLEPAAKTEKKEISNLYSNSKYQSNVFIQNSRKVNEEEENADPDPCLLSVAERRKLFEKRLAAAEPVEAPISAPVTVFEKKKKTPVESVQSTRDYEYFDSGNEYSTCESEGIFFNGKKSKVLGML